MTLHMFVADLPTDLAPGTKLQISGDEAKHAISVRRLRMNEAVQATDGRGRRVLGRICEIGQRELWLEVIEARFEPESSSRITLVQALAKGDRDELAVQACTELGISSVIPWQAERSISRWDAAKASKGVARWSSIAKEATKQSLQTRIPLIREPLDSGNLERILGDFDLVFVLDPTATDGIASQQVAADSSIALVVGPEGGIAPAELAAFENAGAKRVHLGDAVLRTSTAGVVALAIVRAKLGLYN